MKMQHLIPREPHESTKLEFHLDQVDSNFAFSSRPILTKSCVPEFTKM